MLPARSRRHHSHRRAAAPPPAPLRLGRGTVALAAAALVATAATIAVEYARVWRRGSAPLPSQTDDLLEAGRTATEETLAVLRVGYRTGPNRENALLNMLLSFTACFGLARGVTLLIRSGRGGAVLRNIVIADRHVHHFVPGLVVALAAGGISIGARRKSIDRWLALPFGAGTALVVDEAALLLELEDVYWSEEGVLSLQLSFATMAFLAALALAVRLVRRGESFVLPPMPGHLPPGPPHP